MQLEANLAWSSKTYLPYIRTQADVEIYATLCRSLVSLARRARTANCQEIDSDGDHTCPQPNPVCGAEENCAPNIAAPSRVLLTRIGTIVSRRSAGNTRSNVGGPEQQKRVQSEADRARQCRTGNPQRGIKVTHRSTYKGSSSSETCPSSPAFQVPAAVIGNVSRALASAPQQELQKQLEFDEQTGRPSQSDSRSVPNTRR